jgi:hypothetical protein
MALFREPTELWSDLSKEDASRGGLLSANWIGGLILVNSDALGMPLLLVEIGETDSKTLDVEEFATYGVQVQTRKMRIDDRSTSCVILGARDKSDEAAFLRMADLMVAELISIELDAVKTHLEVVFDVLRRWVNFWRRLGTIPSVEKIVGLIAELLVIADWNALDGLSHENWCGPDGAPQDFKLGTSAIEVKATQTRTGPRTHRISSVLQLDDSNVENLYLISYRIKLHANGSRSLFDLADFILGKQEFAVPSAIEKVQKVISDLGISRGSAKKYICFDVIDCRLYKVTGQFPRLLEADTTKSSSVFDIKYSVDLSGADEYILEDNPVNLRSMENWND